MVTAFGATAVAIMVLAYWLEARSKWFVAVFAAACAAASAYGWLIESYPFFAIEGIWSLAAWRRFWRRHRAEARPMLQERVHA